MNCFISHLMMFVGKKMVHLWIWARCENSVPFDLNDVHSRLLLGGRWLCICLQAQSCFCVCVVFFHWPVVLQKIGNLEINISLAKPPTENKKKEQRKREQELRQMAREGYEYVSTLPIVSHIHLWSNANSAPDRQECVMEPGTLIRRMVFLKHDIY